MLRTIAALAAVALFGACGDARHTGSPNGSCSRCHFGASGASGGAPSGAHAVHLRALGGDACAQCHPDPRLGSAVHHDGRLDVVFGALGTQGGALSAAFDRETLRCSGVYCHGAFAGGEAANSPAWTSVGQGQADCGTCHGLPSPATHAGVPADRSRCIECHAPSVDASGNLVAGGKHLDGRVDGGHTIDPWIVAGRAGFHGTVAWTRVATCRGCHGADLEGGSSGVACGRCHGSGPQADCASCHGEVPGHGSGAHASHLQLSSKGPVCAECHPDPRAGSASHMDDRLDLAFGPLATNDGALSPALDRETLRCSGVYCHGAFAGGNAGNVPAWTSVGEGQAECGTCHALPPAATHAGIPADRARCIECHASTVDASGDLVAGGKHLDGHVDGGHAVPWMVTTSGAFHGTSAWQGLSTCLPCHGLDLGGGTAGVACARCHGSGGQLTCTSCHPGVPGGDDTRSSHLAGAGTPSGDCRTCHGQANGHFRLPAPGGSFPDDSCRECHDGQGWTLSGRTPPLLVGWTDTAAGDWHGTRTGTGHGGTLAPAYARGQAPLPCTACHDHHASANAFLFKATVNGRAVLARAIDRAGVGAEALCTACHEGERHAGCLSVSCHGVDPEPAGSGCFFCHGHEGIRNWPGPAGHFYGSCDHCHGGWAPTTEYAAPVISGPPTVGGITAATATVRWSTGEDATSYVEYGIGAAGSIAGDDAPARTHLVTLTELQPSTTYVWRVRSSDRFRNVTESPLQTFTTWGQDDVPRVEVATVSVTAHTPDTTAVAALLWYPVSAPSGTAVEYEVQLAADPAFTAPPDATLGRTDASLLTGNSGWIPGTSTQDSSWPPRPALGFDVLLTNLPQDWCEGEPQVNVYYFRVRARDATGKVSEWSATGVFTAFAADPYGC